MLRHLFNLDPRSHGAPFANLFFAAPTPTTRVTPTGQPMRDGFGTWGTLITFASDANVTFWEKGVQPPGIDGGDNIEASTMHNVNWRTFGVPGLKTLTDGSTRVAYDPSVFDEIVALINVEDTITVTFPNGDTLAFYGRLRSFEPDELVEGSQPEATANFAPTNWDATNNVEAAPVFTGT